MGENKQEAFTRLLSHNQYEREKILNKTGSLGWGSKNSFRLKKKPSKRDNSNSLYLGVLGMLFSSWVFSCL